MYICPFMIRFSHKNVSPHFRHDTPDECGGYPGCVEDQISAVISEYHSKVTHEDKRAFIEHYLDAFRQRERTIMDVFIGPYGAKALPWANANGESIEGLVISLSNRRLFVFRCLAALNIIDKVLVNLHPFTSPTIQHEVCDKREKCWRPKWEASFHKS